MEKKTKTTIIVVFLIMLVVIITVITLYNVFKESLTEECQVDVDCNDFKQYCDNETGIKQCLQFSCGSYMFGLGDYWTCGDYNVCVLMCKYNVTDGKCHYEKEFVDGLNARGCIWHKVYISEPKEGLNENSTLTVRGWMCG